mgnify:CR=1 FL=1
MKINKTVLPSSDFISGKIYLLRYKRVMLDRDLAGLYGSQLTPKEAEDLMFQGGTSRWGGVRKRPCVFTEQGVAMLSSVLRSPRAVQVNIQIMRTFTKIRKMLVAHKDILRKLDDMEAKFNTHLGRHDRQILEIFEAIKRLLAHEERPKRQIGFTAKESKTP